ncbi:protein-tyrosine phosphatase-like protein [Dichotomocladium elegans]|nr:protein-tyrosine phosphatase-like protein [Dichotomocladium elegans]
MYSRSPHPGGQRSLINPPTFIEYKGARFLIVDAPSNNNLPLYIEEFNRWNVTDVVRCCYATYSPVPLKEKGIQVHDWVFGDGEAPPANIVDAWLNLVDERFRDSPQQPQSQHHLSYDDEDKTKNDGSASPAACIATHCVAGLGRAPVLVAIALIELGMPALDAVAYIRERRRGAINNKQLKYIESYKRRSKNKCIIS